MSNATMEQLTMRAQEAIDNEEVIVFDTAAETGQMVGNVKHMSWFKLAVMRALAEADDQYAHLAPALA